ncbi:hypothetical protein FA13DRAFT_369959 [Coprinellus micaceus]|uniref:Secreted protein n=1 Tax=Coprinellus micaceus TaxID=71717 RepID=A0A4Y7TC09_COPMI|nr:hypothetical protein FA13DRAFT_369959 [Coprinellus micaceus]
MLLLNARRLMPLSFTHLHPPYMANLLIRFLLSLALTEIMAAHLCEVPPAPSHCPYILVFSPSESPLPTDKSLIPLEAAPLPTQLQPWISGTSRIDKLFLRGPHSKRAADVTFGRCYRSSSTSQSR